MSSKIKENGFIPSTLYNQILKLLPIASVEAVIVMDNALLFLRRKNNPAKGQWWFPGGRIHKGESLKESLYREVKEETSLEISSYRLINVYSRVFPERHDITIAYLCECKKGKVMLNTEHSEYKLLKETAIGLHPYVLEVISDCDWKNVRPLFNDKRQNNLAVT